MKMEYLRGSRLLEIKRTFNMKLTMQSYIYWTLWTLLLLVKHGTCGTVYETLHIKENEPTGTVVGNITGRGPIEVFLGESAAAFEINGATGVIKTRIQLDRETKDQYTFGAMTMGDSTYHSITVKVTDTNDNSPTFPRKEITIRIGELDPNDNKHSIGSAVDPDLGLFTTQRYEIMAGNKQSVFRLATRRVGTVLYVDLVVQGTLDYETENRYDLTVTAFDGGSPPKNGSVHVIVEIQDANDNQPLFNTSRYSARVMENATVGTSVVQVFATDIDSGENGHIQYHIDRSRSDPQETFTINADSGEVHLNKKLDYEKKSSYELIVVAKDRPNGPDQFQTTAVVTIKIENINDNPPVIDMVFLSEDGTPKLAENAGAEELVARISVSDPDVPGYFSNVNVTLSGGDGHFGLTTKDNVVYLMIVSNPLDREMSAEYPLTIIATDSGIPPLQTTKSFVLKVIDTNDNAPVFTKLVYYATIKEVALPGSSVIQVTAKDRDIGNNSLISYTIVPNPNRHSDWFKIDEQSGLITTKQKVDCETLSQPTITVVATDHGEVPLSANATVVVTILDVNDNQPVFDQSYYNVSVVENKPVGGCILKVTATDPDCGVNAQVTYAIDTNLGFQYPAEFSIDNKTGNICVVKPLDYEKRQMYEFRVIAKDADGLDTTSMVKISVEDVNDNWPVFYPVQYSVNLRTNSLSGKEVVAVRATDPDSKQYGVIMYKIVSGNTNIFTIDPSTGVIKLLASPGNQARVYQLRISATDGGALTSVANAVVDISVILPSQPLPVFQTALYRFQENEAAQINDPVGTVHADQSSGSGTISYSIEAGDPEDYFSIDSTSGDIKVKRSLDHETHAYVLLSIQAQSGNPPSYGRAQVNVTVLDVNDNKPQFAISSIEIPVKENVKSTVPIYQAYAIDKDSGDNGKVRYDLKVNPDGVFKIDAVTGEVTVQKPMDYETKKKYTLVVRARDLGSQPQASEMTLVINVQDVNDNKPLFTEQDYRVVLNENTAVNTKFKQLNTTDRDTGNNARIIYRLAETNQKFGIFPENGFLYVKQALDRETQDQYILSVIAVDNGSPQLSAYTTVTIDLLDVNDNAPVFDNKRYDFSVNENSVQGAEVGTVIAKDADLAQNADIRYTFVDSSKDFNINSQSGKITTKNALDRESQELFSVTVVARDRGDPVLSSSVDVRIVVNDVNDNSPSFVRSGNYVVGVWENRPKGTTVIQVTATDVDKGANGRVSYYLRDSSSIPFVIDDQTGWITTREELDHEKRSKYVLTVVARDGGNPRRESTRIVEVNVLDDNDDGPVFPSPEMTFQVVENVPEGTNVGKVKARDGDSGENGRVTYYIVGGNIMGIFGINMTDGQIYTVRNLDYEAQSSHLLSIKAKDNSILNPKSSVMTVRIVVLDLNDNPPIFSVDPVIITVQENSPPGRSTWTFSASDRDSGINGTVRYRIKSMSPDGDYFTIDAVSGELKTKSQLDHEQLKEMSIIIEASDQGPQETRHVTAITVRVLIQDLNDNKPVFLSRDVIHVMEDEPVGFPMLHVLASDIDSGENGRVTYSIVKGNEDGHFALQETTGLLTIARALDHETKQQFQLNITASDHGHQPNVAWQTLVVNLEDVNDNPPHFDHSIYAANVSENANPNRYIVTIHATDNDTGTNAELFYLIPSGIAENKFAVNNQTGVVTTAKMLDREELSSYIITAYVRDGAFPAKYDTTTLMINVLDMNDNKPVFQTNSYVLRVPEGKAFVGIHTVAAVDMDTGKNGQVRYFITAGNNDNKFILDAVTGELSCSALDRETVAFYNLTITAKDNGDVPMMSTSQIIVQVLDQNDNSPQFSKTSYTKVLLESVAIGTPVVTVSASDRDEAENAKVTYSLGNDTDGMFTIESESGVIKTTGLFDREKRDRFSFVVMATDGGLYGPRNSTVTVDVTISDVNDNPPVFEKIPYTANILQSHPVGRSILQVKATDADESSNAVVMYSLSTSTSYFSLDPSSGVIKTTRALDNSAIGFHTLTIVARDGGNPQLSSQGMVEIRVGSPSGPIVRFEKSEYNASINEGSPQWTTVKKVKASYVSGSAGAISYAIASGNEDNAFMITTSSGLIEVNNPNKLDFETRPLIRLTVMAEGGGVYGYATVWVHLKDQNDNVPKFTQERYVGFVSEGSSRATFVTQVSAMDPDQNENGVIRYSIIMGNDDNAFTLQSEYSGIVKTNIVLDREIKKSYSLEIEAVDMGSPQLSSTCKVKITVIDVNDNSPFFPLPAAVNINEGMRVGTIVTTITANDVDANPTIIYNFANGGNPGAMFSIDRFSGRITLAKPLDHEKQKQYQLQLEATDEKHVERTKVVINVVDDNDNSPIFAQKTYEVFLDELTKPGYAVLTVNATDADSGKNAEIDYAMGLPVDGYQIDKATGTIYTNKTVKFNPAMPTNQLVVTATDRGKPPRTAIVSVRIQIIDVNDHAPVFTKSVYTVHLKEDVSEGTPVVTVIANDADSSRNNKKVDYTILTGNQNMKFKMVSNTGEIFLTDKLDRETVSTYNFTIRGRDHGTPSMESTTIVRIIVDDVNDWAPEFTKAEYYVDLDENVRVKTSVVQISASDRDIGENAAIEYAITSGNDDLAFKIDRSTGWITVEKPLDYETKTEHRLIIRAMDCTMCTNENRLANYTTVVINITDINDHKPTFPIMMYLESVPENSEVGTSVFIAHAKDQDGDVFGKLKYEILEANNLFRINKDSGLVTTNAVFDYETKTNYRFKIRASDIGANSATISVLVNVESVDEYEPRFLQTTYSFSVRGNAVVGDVVGQVQAQDDDGGEDGRLVYSFSENNDYFAINGTTGVVYVKRSFNDARRRKRWVNRYTDQVILGRGKRALETDTVQLKIRASSGKADSKSVEVEAEVAVNRTCPGCGVVAPRTGGLSGTPLVLAIVFAIIGVILVVITALLCFRGRKAKRRPPPPQRHHDTSFDPVHVHGILMSPEQPPLVAREDALPPRYNDIHHYSVSNVNGTTSELSDQSHSASSGRGSVEDNEDDDEEIRKINSGPLNQSQNMLRKGMPDSGIQNDDDNISEHSVRNHKDYLAKLGIDVSKIKSDPKPAGLTHSVESIHQFSEEGGGEGDGLDIGNIIYQKLSEMDSSDDLSSMMTGSAELIFDDSAEPTHAGSLSSVINSEEEFSGSYNWDYLLDWGPQYQPLADVFTEIARLKDENIQPKKQPVTQIVPLRPSQGSNSGHNKVKLYPPPMITDMPPVPGLSSSVPSKPSSTHSSQSNSTVSQQPAGQQRSNKNSAPPNHAAPPIPFSPRSPITHDTSFQSPAYTPSFTPSLSPLGVRTPAIPGYNMPQRGAPSHSSGHSSTHSGANRTRSNNSLSHLSGSEQEFRI